MKSAYFTFILVLIFSSATSQIKSPFISFKNTLATTLFTTKKLDTVAVYSIQLLGKTSWKSYLDTDKINLLPKNFNWSKDMRRIENYKNMALNLRQQDICGRDLPADVHAEVVQKVYIRNFSNF